jgi:hypothetical protein
MFGTAFAVTGKKGCNLVADKNYPISFYLLIPFQTNCSCIFIAVYYLTMFLQISMLF